jgi:hypothetical protein
MHPTNVYVKHILIPLTSFMGIPNSTRMLYVSPTESEVFLKSINWLRTAPVAAPFLFPESDELRTADQYLAGL